MIKKNAKFEVIPKIQGFCPDAPSPFFFPTVSSSETCILSYPPLKAHYYLRHQKITGRSNVLRSRSAWRRLRWTNAVASSTPFCHQNFYPISKLSRSIRETGIITKYTRLVFIALILSYERRECFAAHQFIMRPLQELK